MVRDGLVQIYQDLGQKADVKYLEGSEHWQALRAKFIEEASELPTDFTDKEALTSELGDLLRVIKDTATVAGVDFTEVEKADEAKTAKKGGFLGGAYVETLETTDTDLWNDYYRQNADRFPETTSATPPVEALIYLSNQLAELGKIDRATLLPGGRRESDSHHSFSLALIAYDFARKYCPELDADKVLRFALVHDLLEIITGDEDTLVMSPDQLKAKHRREVHATDELHSRLAEYAPLLEQLADYEKLDTAEAATVYTLDKACTIWTSFWDTGANLRPRGVKTQADIDSWYNIQQGKLSKRLKVTPPPVVLELFENSYKKMREELFDR